MASEFNPSGIRPIGDPFVLHASDGKYYMYSTCEFLHEMGFGVWSSTDLKHWEQHEPCYMLNERSFGYKNCWAPEVVEYNGLFIMHYTSRMKSNDGLRIGVATSKSPLGPFIDVYDKKPMFDPGYFCIDGDVLIDDDGKKYLYFSHDCDDNIMPNGDHHSEIYMVELTDDLLATKGEPKRMFGPEKDYEMRPTYFQEGGPAYRWNEGPFAFKHDGEYYIMYSGNFFATKYYCICVAKSKTPYGPWEKYDKPVAEFIEGKVHGPGHNSVFTDDKGQLYCAYHVHSDPSKPGSNDRMMFIDKLEFVDGKLTMKITY